MNRIEFFSNVKSRCELLRTPQMSAVWSPILQQLDYLIAFEGGETVDRALIENIDVGLRALRNLEDIFPEVAVQLYEVQRLAEAMATDAGMKNRL